MADTPKQWADPVKPQTQDRPNTEGSTQFSVGLRKTLPTREEWRMGACRRYMNRLVWLNLLIVMFWFCLSLSQLRYRQVVLEDQEDAKLGWPRAAERWRFAVSLFSAVCAVIALPNMKRSLKAPLTLIAILQIILACFCIVCFILDALEVGSICIRISRFTGSCWHPQYYLTNVFDFIVALMLLLFAILLLLFAYRNYTALLTLFRDEVQEEDFYDEINPDMYGCDDCGIPIMVAEKEAHVEQFCPKPACCRFCNRQFRYCDVSKERNEDIVRHILNPDNPDLAEDELDKRSNASMSDVNFFDEEHLLAVAGKLEHSMELTKMQREAIQEILREHEAVCDYREEDEISSAESRSSSDGPTPGMPGVENEGDKDHAVYKNHHSVPRGMNWAEVKREFVGDVRGRRMQRMRDARPRLDQFRPGLGCEITNHVDDHESGDGLQVLRLRPGGPSSIAGIRPDDIILRVGERKFSSRAEYHVQIRHFRPFEHIIVYLHRPTKQPTGGWGALASQYKNLKYKVFTDCIPPIKHEDYWMMANGVTLEEYQVFVDLFNTFDTDNSETLDEDEFAKMLACIRKQMTEEEKMYQYMMTDVDNSGEVQFVEFLYWLEKFGFIDEVLWQANNPDHKHPDGYVPPEVMTIETVVTPSAPQHATQRGVAKLEGDDFPDPNIATHGGQYFSTSQSNTPPEVPYKQQHTQERHKKSKPTTEIVTTTITTETNNNNNPLATRANNPY